MSKWPENLFHHRSQKEITTTYKIINELSGKYKSAFYVSSSFFKTDQQILDVTNQKDNESPANQSQRHNSSVANRTDYKGQSKGHDIKDNYKRQNNVSESADKGQRRNAILTLLQEKGNLTIKDFTSVVTEYSEKTIQREIC